MKENEPKSYSDKFWVVICKVGHKQAPGTRYSAKIEARLAAITLAEQNQGLTYYVLEAVERVGLPTTPIEVKRSSQIVFWVRLSTVLFLIGFLLPILFSSKTDEGPVLGCLLIMLALTYSYNQLKRYFQ
jgi:hypothetical protein